MTIYVFKKQSFTFYYRTRSYWQSAATDALYGTIYMYGIYRILYQFWRWVYDFCQVGIVFVTLHYGRPRNENGVMHHVIAHKTTTTDRESKVLGAKMGPIWGLGEPHVCPMISAIWGSSLSVRPRTRKHTRGFLTWLLIHYRWLCRQPIRRRV